MEAVRGGKHSFSYSLLKLSLLSESCCNDILLHTGRQGSQVHTNLWQHGLLQASSFAFWGAAQAGDSEWPGAVQAAGRGVAVSSEPAAGAGALRLLQAHRQQHHTGRDHDPTSIHYLLLKQVNSHYSLKLRSLEQCCSFFSLETKTWTLPILPDRVFSVICVAFADSYGVHMTWPPSVYSGSPMCFQVC